MPFFRVLSALTLALAPLAAHANTGLNPTPIFIVAGGYSTCAGTETPTAGRVADFAKAFVTSVGYDPSRVGVLTSCFPLLNGHAGNEPVWYHYTNTASVKLAARAYIDKIATWLALPENRVRPVFLYGQSHGGWTIVNIVKRFKQLLGPNAKLPPILMVTMDAIDYEGCQPIENERIAKAALTGQLYQSPCNRAPQLSTFNLLPQGPAYEWRNIYQDRCAYLHSGPMDGARNERVVPPTTIAISSRDGLDHLISDQYPEMLWMSAEMRSRLLVWLIDRRPDMDFTMHSGLPAYMLPSAKNWLRSWHERVRLSAVR
jgi:hypothetical protein